MMAVMKSTEKIMSIMNFDSATTMAMLPKDQTILFHPNSNFNSRQSVSIALKNPGVWRLPGGQTGYKAKKLNSP